SAARRQTANIWLTVGQQRDGRPVLRSLYCCGCAYRTCCYVVLYRPCNPDALEYIPTIPKLIGEDSEGQSSDSRDHGRDDSSGSGGGGSGQRTSGSDGAGVVGAVPPKGT
ncbi:unnamed protein product, partial [Sphacelaria rigidula]